MKKQKTKLVFRIVLIAMSGLLLVAGGALLLWKMLNCTGLDMINHMGTAVFINGVIGVYVGLKGSIWGWK